MKIKNIQLTFILKKVMLVRRSTVDLRSWRRSLLLAGKWFCSENINLLNFPKTSFQFMTVGITMPQIYGNGFIVFDPGATS